MKIEELKELRLDRLDIGLLFTNLRKFVDYAETNLDWQHRTQVQKLFGEASKDTSTPPEYYYQAKDRLNDDYQFVIPNAIRYSSLVMLVTYIEWFIKFCENYSEKRGWGESPTQKSKIIIRKIEWLSSRQSKKFTHPFNDRIETLIELRNCIVHDAAIVENEHQKNAVQMLGGIRLGKFLYLENLIIIEQGTIEALMDEVEEWINAFLDYLDIGDQIPSELIIE